MAYSRGYSRKETGQETNIWHGLGALHSYIIMGYWDDNLGYIIIMNIIKHPMFYV